VNAGGIGTRLAAAKPAPAPVVPPAKAPVMSTDDAPDAYTAAFKRGDVPGMVEALPIPTWVKVVSAASSAACAFHGYRRNRSVLWALGWAAAGAFAPGIAPAVAFAQGFGKRKGGS